VGDGRVWRGGCNITEILESLVVERGTFEQALRPRALVALRI
jgi:hypothetical protein